MNSQWHLDDIKPPQKYFEFAEANYDLYRIMIFGKGGITASRQLHQNIADNVQKLLEDEIAATGAEAVVPVMFIANHLAGALLAIHISGFGYFDSFALIMLIDLVTFFLAIGALLLVYIPQPPKTEAGEEAKGNIWKEAVYGFGYIFKRYSLAQFDEELVGCKLIVQFVLNFIQ